MLHKTVRTFYLSFEICGAIAMDTNITEKPNRTSDNLNENVEEKMS